MLNFTYTFWTLDFEKLDVTIRSKHRLSYGKMVELSKVLHPSQSELYCEENISVHDCTGSISYHSRKWLISHTKNVKNI